MEELIPLLLFVIFSILSAIGQARKGKKKKKSTNTGRRKGLTARFITWILDLQKRIEEQSKKVPKGELDWEDLLGGSKPQQQDTESPGDIAQDIDRGSFEEPPSPLSEDASAAMSPSPYDPTVPLGKLNMEGVDTSAAQIKKRRKKMPSVLPTNRADLRKAIVWSEIIGPPIALRDPSGENR